MSGWPRVRWPVRFSVSVNLIQAIVTWEEGASVEDCPIRLVCRQVCRHFLDSDWYGRAHTLSDGATLGQVVLVCMKCVSYLSFAVIPCNLQKRGLILGSWFQRPKSRVIVVDSVAVGSRHGPGAEAESLHVIHKYKIERANWAAVAFECSKPTPSDTPPTDTPLNPSQTTPLTAWAFKYISLCGTFLFKSSQLDTYYL